MPVRAWGGTAASELFGRVLQNAVHAALHDLLTLFGGGGGGVADAAVVGLLGELGVGENVGVLVGLGLGAGDLAVIHQLRIQVHHHAGAALAGMAVGHGALVIKNALAMGLGEPPPVDLEGLDALVQMLLDGVADGVHVAGMAGDEDEVLHAVLDQLFHQPLQVILQDLAGHYEGAGEGSQRAGLARLNGGGDHGAGAVGHDLSDLLGNQQIGAHGQLGAVHLAGAGGDDHGGVLLQAGQVLLAGEFTDVIFHNGFLLIGSAAVLLHMLIA